MRLSGTLLLIVASAILFAGCKKSNKPGDSGINTIDNVLYGSHSYYALGFSFELGDITSTLELPAPDITIHANVDIDGNVTGRYILTPNLIESLSLAGELSTASEAEVFFDSFIEVGSPAWALSAENVKENQIWLLRTAKDNYVKFRIIKLTTDEGQTPPFVQMKFEWRIQRDGSTTFSN